MAKANEYYKLLAVREAENQTEEKLMQGKRIFIVKIINNLHML